MSDPLLYLIFWAKELKEAVTTVITAPVLVQMSVNRAHESLDSGHRQETWLSSCSYPIGQKVRVSKTEGTLQRQPKDFQVQVQH